MPNKSLQATRDGRSSSAIAENVIVIVSAKVLAHGHQCSVALARAGRCRRSLRTATN